jgi:mRNA-degrading endonuclease RelE of RelBE toxin-antitoxin system
LRKELARLYTDEYSDEIGCKLSKLKKRDLKQYLIVRKKMDWITANPFHRFKFLSEDMKGLNRLHFGHFVLVFSIDHEKKTVSFEDYDHHDRIYRKG